MQLVPDLAESFPPRPTAAGRTHSGCDRTSASRPARPLKASDVRATFERDFAVGSPCPTTTTASSARSAVSRRPKHCDLSQGIVADDATGTVTFHLAAPDPDFLNKLTLPFADILPAGTKPKRRHRCRQPGRT